MKLVKYVQNSHEVSIANVGLSGKSYRGLQNNGHFASPVHRHVAIQVHGDIESQLHSHFASQVHDHIATQVHGQYRH